MNKRGTKGLFGERSSIGRPLFERLCSLSRRSVPSALLLLAFAIFPGARAWGIYAHLDNGRVLLMNNDSRSVKTGGVANQGYYDTNSTIGVTYWTHEPMNDNTRAATRYLLHGTNHVLHAADGTPLWHLVNCRAGYVAVTASGRNHIPTSSHAQRSGPPITKVGTVNYYTNEVNSCVFLRNVEDAAVYSPMYEEGIGTIYADLVNSQTLYTDCYIALEIATNVTAAAENEGLTFATAGTDYDKYEWHQMSNTVLSVENGSIASISNGVERLHLNVTEGGTKHYFRIRTHLNYYSPIRFRIRRTSYYEGDADTVGLIAIDNIIASYPPMTIRLDRYGEDYDDSLKGAEVLGCPGDFNVPFQAAGQNGVQAKIKIAWVANNVSDERKIDVKNPKFHYRWRYLNQIVPEWSTLDFSPSTPSYTNDYSATQLVTTVTHTLNQGVGDLEYFFTADLDAQYYSPRDYANDTFVGFGDGWTEQIFAVTNKATYTGLDGVPTGGTDYFVRIREGESNMEWVQLQGTLTVTNTVGGSNDVYKLLTPDGIEPRMTLVGDHSWRYHYEVPTNAIGGTLSFSIMTKEYYTNETDAATWLIRTNELGTVEKTVSEIPFTATLHPLDGPDVGNTLTNISVVLDDSSTHLKIEYNDEQRAFALSHASYQSFNLWTDARVGFRGNSMETNGTDVVSNSGVSEKKQRYNAPFDSSWELCPQVDDDIWTESFNNTGTFSINVWKNIQDIHGWTARNSMLVWGTRNRAEEDLSLALDGFGQGSVGLESFNEKQLPLGLDTVSFTARVAQSPEEYEAFAVYMYGGTLKNYAISAKVTMSQDYEAVGHYPKDMSPINPSVSLVGYHRESQGCYELRMTRTGDKEVTLGIYKWTEDGSKMKATLLKTEKYTEVLWPTSSSDVSSSKWTTVYFLLYTMSNGKVRLEGHLAPSPTTTPIGTDIINMRTSGVRESFYMIENAISRHKWL